MSKRKDPPQWKLVLAMLEAAGSRGVHTNEIYAAFIKNPSQRRAELEREGYVISSTPETLHGRAVGSRYKIVSRPRAVASVSSGAEEPEHNPSGRSQAAPTRPLEDGRLFDVEEAA